MSGFFLHFNWFQVEFNVFSWLNTVKTIDQMGLKTQTTTKTTRKKVRGQKFYDIFTSLCVQCWWRKKRDISLNLGSTFNIHPLISRRSRNLTLLMWACLCVCARAGIYVSTDCVKDSLFHGSQFQGIFLFNFAVQ